MHKHLLAAVLSLAVAMTGASALEAHAKTTFVTIGTGGITGVYYPTGGAIAKIVNAKKDKYDIRATVESTGASVFNINAIMAGDLEFGIAQADRQYQAYNGLSEWEGKPQKDLRAVFALAPEAANANEKVTTVGMLATFVTSAKVPDDVVYAITKEVFENLDEFKKLHPALEGLTRETMLEGLTAPIHPGALKYYKEAGLMK